MHRVSFFVKLRFVSPSNRETLFIAEIQHFLRASHEGADAIRLAVCNLYPAQYGSRSTDLMTATMDQAHPEVCAVAISELDTKLVTAVDGGKLYGMVYGNTSGLA